MPLRNRVDPFGEIHAIAARGLFTGNRGVIHDPGTRTLLKRRWTSRAWIICDCGWRGLKRAVFGRNAPSGTAGWTNLFFLDEPTALAAGHRPCFTCRSGAARIFATLLGKGQGRARLNAPEIDRILHAERLASGGQALSLSAAEVLGLPDGAMVCTGGSAFALLDGQLRRWSFYGYGSPETPLNAKDWRLITPHSTLVALRAGYRPAWHASATAA